MATPVFFSNQQASNGSPNLLLLKQEARYGQSQPSFPNNKQSLAAPSLLLLKTRSTQWPTPAFLSKQEASTGNPQPSSFNTKKHAMATPQPAFQKSKQWQPPAFFHKQQAMTTASLACFNKASAGQPRPSCFKTKKQALAAPAFFF